MTLPEQGKDTNQASEPILPRDVLVMYSTKDLINLVSTVSEILAERKESK